MSYCLFFCTELGVAGLFQPSWFGLLDCFNLARLRITGLFQPLPASLVGWFTPPLAFARWSVSTALSFCLLTCFSRPLFCLLVCFNHSLLLLAGLLRPPCSMCPTVWYFVTPYPPVHYCFPPLFHTPTKVERGTYLCYCSFCFEEEPVQSGVPWHSREANRHSCLFVRGLAW